MSLLEEDELKEKNKNKDRAKETEKMAYKIKK